MRRSTKLALAAGAALAVAGMIARGRLGRRGSETPPPLDAMFTVYAPGGRYAFWCSGPVGWVTARLMPIMEARVYRSVAEMLELQPDDELLDVGCGPGAFLATQAQHARRVVGLDVSPTMMRVAERRLADRIAAQTARLVLGSAAQLPFGDGEFSAVSAIFAPVSHAEAFRVLRSGGRFVLADANPRRSPSERAGAWGIGRYSEAEHRRAFEEAGFMDPATGWIGGYLLVSGRKPAAT